jgi:hypothetical protein
VPRDGTKRRWRGHSLKTTSRVASIDNDSEEGCVHLVSARCWQVFSSSLNLNIDITMWAYHLHWQKWKRNLNNLLHHHPCSLEPSNFRGSSIELSQFGAHRARSPSCSLQLFRNHMASIFSSARCCHSGATTCLSGRGRRQFLLSGCSRSLHSPSLVLFPALWTIVIRADNCHLVASPNPSSGSSLSYVSGSSCPLWSPSLLE